jgi:hypothetical protein
MNKLDKNPHLYEVYIPEGGGREKTSKMTRVLGVDDCVGGK